MIKRTIKTRLVGKEELFKVIALGEATRLPILFIGVPGVAKTQTLMDYAAAMSGFDNEKARKETFVLELDEGTKSSEIKGRVNMENLLTNKKYTIDAPIADARYVLINEVDKGSSAVRNTMLSVMREKALFLGSEIRKCNWELFAGSCNIIPTDEDENPFWDRFLIKYTVERVRLSDIYSKAWKNNVIKFPIVIPEKEDLESTSIDAIMMKKFAKKVHKNVSDRTMMAMPMISKAIKLIWGFSDAEAIMKACELICPEKTQALSAELEDPAIVSIKTKIKTLTDGSIQETDLLMATIQGVQNEISQFGRNPQNQTKAEELDLILKDTISKSNECQKLIESLSSSGDAFKNLVAGLDPNKK